MCPSVRPVCKLISSYSTKGIYKANLFSKRSDYRNITFS